MLQGTTILLRQHTDKVVLLQLKDLISIIVYPVSIYLLKVNNRNTRRRLYNSVVLVSLLLTLNKFSHLVLVFLLLTLNHVIADWVVTFVLISCFLSMTNFRYFLKEVYAVAWVIHYIFTSKI